MKRATDLILGPLDQNSVHEFKIADYRLPLLINRLRGGLRTGCVKATSPERLSRSAMLLYNGRVVGCIYNCRSKPETSITEQALQSMLEDLTVDSTLVQAYDLPQNIVLPMSALFLGQPVQRNDGYDARAYFDYICSWFEGKVQTACLAITFPNTASTCLAFVYKGKFSGAFNVETQKLIADRQIVYELLKEDPRTNIEASILPPEMTSPAVRFGFALDL